MSDKIYDLSQLEELAGGSEEFVNSMVDTFLEHTPSQLEEMKKAFSGKDWTTMGAIAHKIKPNIDLFGIKSIYTDIREIESKGKNGVEDAALTEQISKVDSVLRTAFEQLRSRTNG
ncbi:MAG TPA: hypothetical protein DCG19_05335 [Cryomorphaceae bacterium]|nr:hypothetical protein [Owenweeksia sp.]MBF99342.1 hypothetical protein [Owenweeksia sp.]HAD96808.1 hypothetical protein [Cryomorphaceae bacterium]HBF21749.1 hypothetical protein [Cryomorphaceae bacterium]HCQ15956.1 hypothetical protein [Cryomorphaceae bacterium]|tara:strand:+ start:250 stop:597 length:348 start_codon:yes stop_codon:yes gene_type:complete